MGGAPDILFHGGVGERWPGRAILPNMAAHRYVAGCAHCEAQKHGINAADAPTPEDWVYATTDLDYARYYASRAGKGWLYEVRLEGDVEKSTEDHFPTWRGRRAVVVHVLEKRITLTMEEREALFVRWGGTPGEFSSMVASMGGGHLLEAKP